MRISIGLTNYDGLDLREIVRAADQAAVDTVWVPDHLIFHRPILAGDKLWFDSYLDSVIESHGAILTEIRGEVTDDDGKPVLTSIVTILGEAEHPDQADEVTAQIAAARDAAVARMVAKQNS